LKQAKYVQAVLNKFFSRDDLPESISKQESQIRYYTLVWIAWYQYRAGNLDEMANFLQKSLDFSPYLRVENISHWLTSFQRFSDERGEKVNVDSLTNSLQWQQLISVTLRLKNLIISNSYLDKTSSNEHKQIENYHSNNFRIVNHNLKETTSNSIQESQLNNILGDPLEIDLESANKYRIAGDALLSQGHKKEAIKCYQTAVQINPNLLEAHYKLATFLREQGDLDGAIASCQNVLRLKPDTPGILEKLADALFQRGKDADLVQAVGYYEQAIDAEPNNLQLYFKALEIKPQNLKFYLRLGQELVNRKQWAKAVVLLQIAKEACLDNQEIIFLLEKAFNQLQQQANNSHIYNLIEFNLYSETDLNFTSAMSFLLIGESLKKDKKINEASICYEKAVELQPDNYKFHHELGNIFREQQNFDNAIIEAQKTIELKPDFAWAYHNLGRAFERKGLIDEAIKSYRHTLEVDPNLAVTKKALDKLLDNEKQKTVQKYKNLADSKAKEGKLNESISLYKEAIKLQPDNYRLHHCLGNVLRQQGDFDGAIAEARKTIELKDDFYWGHHNLGRALEQKGLIDEAIQSYRNVLKLKPDLSISQKSIEKLICK
jgi:tetratricopeptide (TPR) repeat protein